MFLFSYISKILSHNNANRQYIVKLKKNKGE